MSYLAPLAAALAAWIFGAAWYTALCRQYRQALGLAAEAPRAKPPLGPLLATFLGELVMAVALAWLLARMSVVGWMWGALAGVIVGAGVLLPAVIVNHLFPGRPHALMAIDGLHWVGVAVIESAVLGAFA